MRNGTGREVGVVGGRTRRFDGPCRVDPGTRVREGEACTARPKAGRTVEYSSVVVGKGFGTSWESGVDRQGSRRATVHVLVKRVGDRDREGRSCVRGAPVTLSDDVGSWSLSRSVHHRRGIGKQPT